LPGRRPGRWAQSGKTEVPLQILSMPSTIRKVHDDLRQAIEKLNSDVRNYLTPIFAYTDLMSCTVAEADRRKLAVMSHCADSILTALDEFVASVSEH